jgi:hypothetical protein
MPRPQELSAELYLYKYCSNKRTPTGGVGAQVWEAGKKASLVDGHGLNCKRTFPM